MSIVEFSDSDYVRAVDELRKSAKASRAKTLAVLASTSCEALAKHQIENTKREDARFDAYYREKHELAKRKLIDRLKTALIEAGVDFQIITEEDIGYGKNDVVVIRNGRRLTVEGKNGAVLPVEIKASMGLDLTQIERYLLAGEKLLLLRIMTGQAKLLDPAEHAEFLNESTRDLAAKAQRLLDNKPILITGVECYHCPLTQCPHNRAKPPPPERKFVHMSAEEFDEDLDLFLRQLYPTIEAAVNIIMRELGVGATSSVPVEQQSVSAKARPRSQSHRQVSADTESHEPCQTVS